MDQKNEKDELTTSDALDQTDEMEVEPNMDDSGEERVSRWEAATQLTSLVPCSAETLRILCASTPIQGREATTERRTSGLTSRSILSVNSLVQLHENDINWSRMASGQIEPEEDEIWRGEQSQKDTWAVHSEWTLKSEDEDIEAARRMEANTSSANNTRGNSSIVSFDNSYVAATASQPKRQQVSFDELLSGHIFQHLRPFVAWFEQEICSVDAFGLELCTRYRCQHAHTWTVVLVGALLSLEVGECDASLADCLKRNLGRRMEQGDCTICEPRSAQLEVETVLDSRAAEMFTLLCTEYGADRSEPLHVNETLSLSEFNENSGGGPPNPELFVLKACIYVLGDATAEASNMIENLVCVFRVEGEWHLRYCGELPLWMDSSDGLFETVLKWHTQFGRMHLHRVVYERLGSK